MHVKYDTKGICAVRVEFDVEDGVIRNVSFLGGCDGNHKGLAALAEGMTPEEAEQELQQILKEKKMVFENTQVQENTDKNGENTLQNKNNSDNIESETRETVEKRADAQNNIG